MNVELQMTTLPIKVYAIRYKGKIVEGSFRFKKSLTKAFIKNKLSYTNPFDQEFKPTWKDLEKQGFRLIELELK